jgi:hypothetical protein
MFLKRDPKNRSIISRFLAAFIRPFMSERPCQLPQLFFHSQDGPRHIQEPVVQWNTHMSQYLDADGDNTYARCFLHHIEYHKCSDRVGHELLVFHFTHWDTSFSAVGVVCVDRTINQENTSARQSGLICPSLSDDTVAHDTASIVGSPHDAEAYIKEKYGASNVLCTMQFPSSSRPSTLQVSTILALVNEHSIFYTLYQHQCYWYADTVWRSLKRLFLGNEHLGEDHNSRAHFAGFQLGPSDESINVVCERYELAWAQTLEQLSQARNLREAQIARVSIYRKIVFLD